jgi:hypothetical protein
MTHTPFTTTLNRIHACDPCDSGWEAGLAAAGKTEPDDEPILFSDIAQKICLASALWCCQAEPRYSRHWRLFAVWCSRRIQHLMSDPRSIAALDVAERHARGEASDGELAAAADDAAYVANAAAREAQLEAFVQLCKTGELPAVAAVPVTHFAW